MLSLPGEGCLAGSLMLRREEVPVWFLPVATNRSSWKLEAQNFHIAWAACLLANFVFFLFFFCRLFGHFVILYFYRLRVLL